MYSLGFGVSTDGTIRDVIVDGLAYKAGLAPGFQIIAVNGRAFTPDLLRAAIQDAVGSGPNIDLIVENTGYYKTITLNYHGGERYPQFVRVDGTPARLDDILQPMTK
jgi:predicted metalloprotease with PDZ domain